ncbi:phospholipase D-like domain-containing protein [Halalkalibacter urbisdiaboli]|uniref:phospholipase D-like domain-containing protein n=1 Tax=Halalkalibacter urbisdiaboli TaxID=1960589 RepID=UPI000B43A4E9|nr:phospholipase D family protein [Halalkalibacter urbisdiaboli]
MILIYIAAIIIGLYVVYAFISGVIVFKIHKHKKSSYQNEHTSQRFYGDKPSQDRVVLVEERHESAIARINLIENAQKTLDISYYSIHPGTTSEIFLASVVDAADRGVKIRIHLDGIFHSLKKKKKEILYSFTYHPNIQLKFYEPFDILRPWKWNNRLHDKLIIVDDRMAMIGGRNIGDKYFAPPGCNGAKNDRDVVIINKAPNEIGGSVLSQIKKYYDYVWNHPFSNIPISTLTNKQQTLAEKVLDKYREHFKQLPLSQPNMVQLDLNWEERSLPTNKVTFIHNPIERLNKEPWIWYEISDLMKKAKDSIFIQSPYIIPTSNMLRYLNKKNTNAHEIEALTNSLAASPNIMAYSGYNRYRKKIVNSGIDVYEFQGPSESHHTKTFIFDHRICLVGSFNLDPRSAYLNTEVMVVIDSEAFARQLKDKIDPVINEGSLLVNNDGSYRRHPSVKEKRVSTLKVTVARLSSGLTRFIENLL